MLLNIDDYRAAARDTLPHAVFEYIDGGAGDELTLARNRAGFEQIALRPRVLVDASDHSLATTVLGTAIRAPLLLGPAAGMQYVHPDAELAVARAAAEAGLIYGLTTHSSRPLEEVAAATPGPRWFQLYMPPQWSETEALIDRAAAAGYRALVVTVDAPELGWRERSLRSPIDSEPGFPATRFPTMARFVGPSELTAIRTRWDGPLLVKGIQTAEDATLAADLGADGVIVSNHGGRQLDTVLASIEILPEVVDAVADRVEVLLDGGIRRGTDIVKALALGARAVLIGRPYIYGLAVDGEPGVAAVIDLLIAQLENAFNLLGVRSVADLGPETVQLLPGFAGQRAGSR